LPEPPLATTPFERQQQRKQRWTAQAQNISAALRNLALDADVRKRILSARAVRPLLQLVAHGDLKSRQSASCAIKFLTTVDGFDQQVGRLY
jgi:hypothetical protein